MKITLMNIAGAAPGYSAVSYDPTMDLFYTYPILAWALAKMDDSGYTFPTPLLFCPEQGLRDTTGDPYIMGFSKDDDPNIKCPKRWRQETENIIRRHKEEKGLPYVHPDDV